MHYKLKVGQYNGFGTLEIDIPEEVKFFYKEGTVGRVIHNGCEHYTTVVDKDKYDEWLKTIRASINFIGKYAIVTICDVHNDTPLPTVDKETWFKDNNIDFGQYTLVTYDENLLPMNAIKIVGFQDIWSLDVVCVTLRDFFSNGEYFSVQRHKVEFSAIEPSPLSDTTETLMCYDGNEGKTVWNTIFAKAMENFNFEPEYADPSYDLLKVKKETHRAFNKLFKKSDDD